MAEHFEIIFNAVRERKVSFAYSSENKMPLRGKRAALESGAPRSLSDLG
uniref:Uncharacterized protein n=1 Tax=Candidatus Kentrum sp. DK TaxID=2126562 RepID=A0A450RUR6_9GAMM|nr:MAG: hypothetical protein BECKDK2373C_GA0170839_100265 [Candidatus Kentron sp. DK]VFJ67085.1 MAG: hypothetical protein BECKDK2373B_GA0170837_11842 [Candidatus Kentron sp. DK]